MCIVFQSSIWRNSDGSRATYIDWGVRNRHAQSPNSSCQGCLQQNSLIISESTDTSGLRCSAFKVSDAWHVSTFPVNCSTRFYSRVICDLIPFSDPSGLPPETPRNLGEFPINQGILSYSNTTCPDGYTFRIASTCMTLVLVEDYIFSTDSRSIICNKADTERICTDIKGKLPGQDALRNQYIYDGQTQTSLYYLVNDILKEFYAESAELYCNIDGNETWARDKEDASRYSFYLPCVTEPVASLMWDREPPVSLYTCDDGSMIADALLCDGTMDCPGGGDERGCDEACSMFQYRCQRGGACVHYDKLCDATTHCPDGDDETFCQRRVVYPYFGVDTINAMSIPDLCDPPSGDLLMCRNTLQCYPSSAICHYDHINGVMAYCKDGSHMGWGSYCEYVDCQGHYKCPWSYCVPVRKVCDGVSDCPNGDDERNCETYTCPGHMRCPGVSYCVPPKEMCDGVAHCPLTEDEKYCQTCPSECSCSGTAIFCTNSSIDELVGHVSPPSALILHAQAISYYELFFNTDIMDRVMLLDLRYGIFSSLLEQHAHNIKLLTAFTSVKLLFLNYLGFKILPPQFINGPNVIHLDLSHNSIQSIHKFAFKNMKNIKYLSLSFNSLQSFSFDTCRELESLSILHLNGNPLTSISETGVLHSAGLQVLRSDWYIVCCVAAHVADCEPQEEFVSSCSNLISSTLQKTVVMGEAMVITIGNLGAIIVQVLSNEDTKFLVVNLVVADLLMGGYLLAIASVDITYHGTFYTIVHDWTHGKVCFGIGVIQFVSSQASILILSILSVGRMISIEKIGGMRVIKSRLRLFCIGAWITSLAVAISFTLHIIMNDMAAQNSLCITLGISKDYTHISIVEFIYHLVFITCNCVLIVVIMTSMVYIFFVIVRSSRSVKQSGGSQSNSRRTPLVNVGWRLFLILMCNIFSWLPFLVVSSLLIAGEKMHDYIIQWFVILGVPICALTDPFMYNMATLRTYINRKTK
jgi:hypothetical protein